MGQTKSVCHVNAGSSRPRSVSAGNGWRAGLPGCFGLFSGDTGEHQQRPGRGTPTRVQHSSDVSHLRLTRTCGRQAFSNFFILYQWFSWQQRMCWTGYGGSRGCFYLTSPRFCVGDVYKAIHHLAHLLHLRSRAVDWAAWFVRSFRDKKFITDVLLLLSGSVPLRPAQTNTPSLIRIIK